MTLKFALEYSTLFLRRNGIEESEFKALCVVCDIATIKNSEFEAHKNDYISDKKLADMLWKLKNGEPLQYVLGKWEFYEREFYVGSGVLIPRPETEELVDRAVRYIKKLKNPIAYDLCSGSGCIGISIAEACKSVYVYLIEKSDDALHYLNKNAAGVNNVEVIKGDIKNIENISLPSQKADVIISNPPYIKSGDIGSLQKEVTKEPHIALDGGKDGLDFYRIINDNWSDRLKSGGMLFLEIGDEQAEDIRKIFSAKYKNISVFKDIYGNDRIVSAVKGQD